MTIQGDISVVIPEHTVTFSKERLSDLLVTAVEGGIGYWARAYYYNPEAGVHIVNFQEAGKGLGVNWAPLDALVEAEDPATMEHFYSVTLDDLAQTCAKAIAGEYGLNGTHYVNQWLSEEEDSITADVIMQLATIGELTYG